MESTERVLTGNLNQETGTGNSREVVTESAPEEKRDAFIERLFDATSGALDIFTIYIGDRLGFYEVLAEDGALTSAQLATRTGTQERYVREWLEQQTVAGILELDDTTTADDQRRFLLPAGHDEVLAHRESLNYLVPLAQLAAGAVQPLPSVVEAFRRGGGVPFEAYGDDLREGQARMNRNAFLQQLGQEWLPSITDIHDRLRSDPAARVADIGCGHGWSSIGIAKSYPKARVDGVDLDAPSIEEARVNATQAGLGDRLQFHAKDAGNGTLPSGRYDLVTAFECVHDMSDPVGVLRSMGRLVKDDGAVIIMDERVEETFTPEGNEVERFMYGCSVLHCLPVGMADGPSACTGTVMRPPTLRRYAHEAGFRDMEVLPIDNFFFRFYRLRK
jgi:SAM-dependent methyltransferase